MPYKLYTKTKKDPKTKKPKKRWCTRNKRTGQEVCYKSKKKRETGIRMREMTAHGFKPTK